MSDTSLTLDKRIIILSHPKARANAVQAVQTAPDGYKVIVSEPNRTNDQNAKFHAICGDIAKSGTKWAGKSRTAQQWKVLLVSGHAVATKEDSEIVPGLENEFVSIRESTALMSIKRGASLITYTLAFCDLNGIKVKESFYDPESGLIYE